MSKVKKCKNTGCNREQCSIDKPYCSSMCCISDLERQLEEARDDIYKYAEIALMEGEDEFGHSWEDFKYFVLDEQLKEKGENE